LGLIGCWQLTGADAVRDHENRLGTPTSQLTNARRGTSQNAADQHDLASTNELCAPVGQLLCQICR
jgi:hypothetical protein